MKVDPSKVHLSEKDLEDYLFENPNEVLLPYSQMAVKEWIGRQYRVPSGIIDLLGITTKNSLVVVELKNASFNSSHLTQVCRYARDIEIASESAGIVRSVPTKLLIWTYDPSSEIIIEANSVDVSIMTLQIDFEMSLGGCWRISDYYKEERANQISMIGDTEPFIRLATLSQAEFAASMEESEDGRL